MPIRRLPATASVIALTLVATTAVLGQFEGALVTRHGAVVRGTLEGSLLALDEAATVVIEPGSRIVGDLVLPAEKAPASGAGRTPGGSVAAQPTVNGAKKLSPRVTVTLPEAASLRGRQRVAEGFSLPRPEKPKMPPGTESAVLQTEKGGEPDYARLRDLTLRNPKRELTLPPGAYGNLAIESGRLLLGVPGNAAPLRYHFQSLAVGPNAAVDLLGPVVVIVGRLGPVDGKLGSERFDNWLDLRVEAGDVTLGADSEVHGVVTATDSAVTLGRRMTLRGGLVCDRATIEANARFTGVKPSWSKEASGNARPRFIHKAARVEQRLPELADRQAVDFRVSVNYHEDVPTISLSKRRSTGARTEQHEARRAYFEACCALFDGTGFTQGAVVMQLPGREPAGPPDNIVVPMERWQFEDHLWTIGRKMDPRECIRLIRGDPLLLNLFMERSRKVAQAVTGPRSKENDP